MQFHLLNERFSIQKLAAWEAYSETPYRGAILDRSLPGDRVFCRLHYELGNISKLEWETYERSFEIFTNSLIPPSLMIFLDVDPNIALQRIQKRDRLAEKEISDSFGKEGRDDTMYEYLVLLQQGYYDLIAEIQEGRHTWSRGMTVLNIDWNDDFKSVDQIITIIKESP
jgi:deoxyadenosine/deoxycytidine kinase